MTNPVALVTGASIGIGEQFARILAERGNDLVLVARDAARLEALAKELEATHGNRAEVLAADLIDHGRSRRASKRAPRTSTCSSTTPGFGTFGNFHELDVDTEDREIQLNVLALVRLTHAAAGGMVERGPRRDPERRVARGLPADAERRDLRRDEGVRALVHPGGARGAEGHRRLGVRARTRVHADRVPGTRVVRSRRASRASCGRKPSPSRAPASTGSRRTRPVIVPGAMNRVAAGVVERRAVRGHAPRRAPSPSSARSWPHAGSMRYTLPVRDEDVELAGGVFAERRDFGGLHAEERLVGERAVALHERGELADAVVGEHVRAAERRDRRHRGTRSRR